ncbi:LAO/AO transport system kinase [Rhodovulum sp. ES.010]|uniref:methylmalonyl Co-A mutase-associated GTPase MeaB n=1 Tax=Rhodovulum sp. ES.010 TaxID=1882821 RepID=UPI000928A331|nr:methylmalonyl Co-A mutase-associated GTPase MeaB [Rhodovulum sp. ES.010]SIO34367.1 LAO/AO transport system kinase [Rhodovulum sp. ES.010]
MARRYIPSPDLIAPAAAGETWAIARLISRAEVGVPEVREAIGQIYKRAGRAHVIGITGVPGSGKSTLVGKLVRRLRGDDLKVAVVAIDPSSPYSGGSILGDRIRMSDLVLDPNVFIRSMATRGAVGGMAHAALDVVDILDLAGFDKIIIETVGVGQDEVEIAKSSHTTVVVSAPGLGDEIQAIKAGILEIADIHVVSKCDRSDANRTLTDLKMMLKDGISGALTRGWLPPVIGTSSVDGDGFDELVATFDKHLQSLDGPAGAERRAQISTFRLQKAAETLMLERLRDEGEFGTQGPRVASRQTDPYAAASAIVKQFSRETNHV